MSVPDDVIEGAAVAAAAAYITLWPVEQSANAFALMQREHAIAMVRAALSALEAAGYVVVRDEGAYPRAFVEFALRHTWPERAEAHGHAAVHDIIKHHPFAQMYAPTPGRAVVDLAAEPQFRLTLSEEARAEIERLEHAPGAQVKLDRMADAVVAELRSLPTNSSTPPQETKEQR